MKGHGQRQPQLADRAGSVLSSLQPARLFCHLTIQPQGCAARSGSVPESRRRKRRFAIWSTGQCSGAVGQFFLTHLNKVYGFL